jgi:hypothetical protein
MTRTQVHTPNRPRSRAHARIAAAPSHLHPDRSSIERARTEYGSALGRSWGNDASPTPGTAAPVRVHGANPERSRNPVDSARPGRAKPLLGRKRLDARARGALRSIPRRSGFQTNTNTRAPSSCSSRRVGHWLAPCNEWHQVVGSHPSGGSGDGGTWWTGVGGSGVCPRSDVGGFRLGRPRFDRRHESARHPPHDQDDVAGESAATCTFRVVCRLSAGGNTSRG